MSRCKCLLTRRVELVCFDASGAQLVLDDTSLRYIERIFSYKSKRGKKLRRKYKLRTVDQNAAGNCIAVILTLCILI